MSEHNNISLDQEEALEGYFNDLLVTTTDSKNVQQKNSALKLVHSSVVTAKVVESEKTIQTVEENELVAIEQESESLLANKPAKALKEETENNIPVIASEISVDNKLHENDGRPVWANESFEAVVFVIKQMKFAIPTFAIKTTQPLSSELKKMSNQPDWVMGLDCSGDAFTAIVDTGLLLLNQPSSDCQELILLADSRWGLAVDKILSNVHVASANVNWRYGVTSRQWLSGLESKQHLAIIEPVNIFSKD